jgi:drug/metabolite transporter (DMT)-like permease
MKKPHYVFVGSHPLFGDLLALLGGFLYALENVLQEHYIKSTADVLNFLGFIGLFGLIISFAEAALLGELSQFSNLASENIPTAIVNYLGLAAV